MMAKYARRIAFLRQILKGTLHSGPDPSGEPLPGSKFIREESYFVIIVQPATCIQTYQRIQDIPQQKYSATEPQKKQISYPIRKIQPFQRRGNETGPVGKGRERNYANEIRGRNVDVPTHTERHAWFWLDGGRVAAKRSHFKCRCTLHTLETSSTPQSPLLTRTSSPVTVRHPFDHPSLWFSDALLLSTNNCPVLWSIGSIRRAPCARIYM